MFTYPCIFIIISVLVVSIGMLHDPCQPTIYAGRIVAHGARSTGAVLCLFTACMPLCMVKQQGNFPADDESSIACHAAVAYALLPPAPKQAVHAYGATQQVPQACHACLTRAMLFLPLFVTAMHNGWHTSFSLPFPPYDTRDTDEPFAFPFHFCHA